MSESVSAPTPTPAPTAAPLPPSPLADSKPAPNTQPPLTVSEAARTLAAQRRATAQQVLAGVQQAPARSPAAPSAPSAPSAAPSPTQSAPPTQAAPAATATGLSAIERALGVPDGGLSAAPAQDGAAPAPATTATDGIELDGRRLSVAEIREAWNKANDYTRKTQALAEEGRQLQARQQALADVLPHIQPELMRLAEQLQNAQAPLPAPDLLATDPDRYHREKALWDQAQEDQRRLANLEALRVQAAERAMASAVQQANEQLGAELPFWKDETSRQAAQRFIVDWARTKGGFSDPELRGMTSAHHLKTLLKAASFDRMIEQSKSATPVPAITGPRGSAPPPAPTERLAQANERFEQKLDWRAGAALIAARRANGHA